MSNKKSNKTQIEILKVAEELIAQKGFKGATIREIAQKANVNVAMISYYFGSKERMMTHLYQFRVQKSKKHFAEFCETIKDGKPTMQLKEIIKNIVSEMFYYQHFHGYVSQELSTNMQLKKELDEYYQLIVNKLDLLIRKGVSSGVFSYTPKAEDLVAIIIGTSRFAIRNESFFKQYVPTKDYQSYPKDLEIKVRNNILLVVLAVLGVVKE